MSVATSFSSRRERGEYFSLTSPLIGLIDGDYSGNVGLCLPMTIQAWSPRPVKPAPQKNLAIKSFQRPDNPARNADEFHRIDKIEIGKGKEDRTQRSFCFCASIAKRKRDVIVSELGIGSEGPAAIKRAAKRRQIKHLLANGVESKNCSPIDRRSNEINRNNTI